MKNLFISDLHNKDADHFTSDLGLTIRRKIDKPFKKMCNVFTNANIIKLNQGEGLSDEEYFEGLSLDYIPLDNYPIKKNKNNIIVERYPELNPDEPYIFVCNHTCPEDIETVLNVLDRNAYLILGSIESLQYNPEMYLSWLNGMIPFDIMDKKQRKEVLIKMRRVLKSNSILIFPEGSHNYSPNMLINNLFDGPVNLALQTNRKIVIVTLIKDMENNTSYIDVGNPIDIKELDINMDGEYSTDEEIEKHYVKGATSIIRDKMATSVYHIISRHFKPLSRGKHNDIEEELRMEKIKYAFKKLKWDRDVFDAEYLTKETKEEKEQKEVTKTLSDLALDSIMQNGLCGQEWILSQIDLENKNVVNRMRKYWKETKSKTKILKK